MIHIPRSATLTDLWIELENIAFRTLPYYTMFETFYRYDNLFYGAWACICGDKDAWVRYI